MTPLLKHHVGKQTVTDGLHSSCTLAAKTGTQYRPACNINSSVGATTMQAMGAVATSCLLLLTPARAAELVPAPQLDRSWAACRPKTSCVSTNSFTSPSQYLAPWSFQPDTQEVALRHLLGQLSSHHAVLLESDAAAGFVLAQLPVGSSNSDYDTVRFRLQPDGVVLFRSDASKTKPEPPFCLTPGCISGPGNRQRMESLRDALGWTVLETDEDKEWVQILLH